jgi:hypothetical protein
VDAKITKITTPSGELIEKLHKYFIKSKPFSFCESKKSIALRNVNISTYLDELLESEYIYTGTKNEELVFVMFGNQRDKTYIDFAVGFWSKSPHLLVQIFHASIYELMNETSSDIIYGELNRNFKKSSYIKWLTRYDKKCRITDKEISWHKDEWKN